jgi:hypothetical protein
MKIRSQNEQEIIASKSFYKRLEPVLFFSIIGTAFYMFAPTLPVIVCWILAGLYLVSAILFPEDITADSIQQVVVIRNPIFGLFSVKRFIPFDKVQAVQVGYRRVFGLSTSRWKVTLILDKGTADISSSPNELQMRHLGSVISKQLGVKFISDTFKPELNSQDQKFFFRRRW